MLGALNIIGGALSAVQFVAGPRDADPDSLEALCAAERRLARAQLGAIRRARAARKAGQRRPFLVARDEAQRLAAERGAMVEQIRTAVVRFEEVHAALAEATAKLSPPAPAAALATPKE